jgi:hypothetical protein
MLTVRAGSEIIFGKIKRLTTIPDTEGESTPG